VDDMTLERDFFSPRVFEDRSFLGSIAISLVLAIAGIGGLIYVLHLGKIAIDPIAKIVFVDAPTTLAAKGDLRHISAFAEL
jgi:hypothetical protein